MNDVTHNDYNVNNTIVSPFKKIAQRQRRQRNVLQAFNTYKSTNNDIIPSSQIKQKKQKEQIDTQSIIKPKPSTKSLYDNFEINLKHGMIITLEGTTNAEYRHGIKKEPIYKLPRISLSFRQMNNLVTN